MVTPNMYRVTTPVMEALHQHRQCSKADPEQGGTLVGTRVNDCYVIKHATLPSDEDTMDQHNFVRSVSGHYDQVAALINQDRDLVYLGDWHTHFEDYPTLSKPDIDAGSLASTLSRQDFIILVVGTKAIRAWVFTGCVYMELVCYSCSTKEAPND